MHELFDRLDFNTPGGLASFAKLLLKYNDRELGGVTFTYVGSSRNHGIYHFQSTSREKSPPSPSPVVPDEVSSVVTVAERSLDASRAGDRGDRGVLAASVNHLKLNSDVLPTSGNYSGLPDDGCKKSLKAPVRTVRYTAVEHLNPMVADLINSKVVAVVMEFPTGHRDTDTHPPRDPHRLVLYRPGGDLWRIDCEKLKDQPMLGHSLRLSLLHKTIVAHDAKPILRWLHKTFGFMPADVRCTRTAARVLLNGSGSQDDDLGACIQRHLPIGNESGTGMSGRFTLTTPSDHSSRQGGDEEHLHELLAALEKELKTADLERTWELENAVLPAFATMEANGMHVDPALLLPLVLKGDVQAKVLFKHVDRATHRIHSSFDPLGTVTGRATSKNPPLQNVKRGSFREVFSAPEGCCLVMGDYANIDLRVVAAESGDETMLAAFSRGEDLHLNTAAAVFGKQLVDVTPQERQLAKAFNLGLINGQLPAGMVTSAKERFDLVVSEDEARRYREKFLEIYPKIRERNTTCWHSATKGVGEVRTRTGRRRLIADNATEGERLRLLLNTPIQGGTADGMKKAMILLHQRLPSGALLVSNIHDELIVECPAAIAEAVRDILVSSMVEGMQWVFPEVSIDVDAKICATWAEK